jgi:hypothetical protein
VNYKHAFPRVSGYQRVCDIMEVDITEFRVYPKLSRVVIHHRFRVSVTHILSHSVTYCTLGNQ